MSVSPLGHVEGTTTAKSGRPKLKIVSRPGTARAQRRPSSNAPPVPRKLPDCGPTRRAAGAVAGRSAVAHLPAGSIEHLASMLPAAHMVELPDQGHLAQAFAPELLCSHVLRFIDNLASYAP